MVRLLLDEAERNIVDMFNPKKSKYQLSETLPVNFIINNKLCLSLYSEFCREFDSNFDSQELEQIWRKARYMISSIDELHIISKAFEENGVDHVFLFKAIESRCDSTDVDTVIEDTKIERAAEILETLGYFKPLFPYEKYHFVKPKNGGTEVIQIDLRTEKGNTSSHYIFDEKKARILNNKRKVNGLYVPSIEDDLLICIERTIDKNEIPIGTMLHIAHLLENSRDINYIKKVIKKGWYTPLLHAVYVINILYRNLFSKEIESPLIPIAERVHKESRILGFLAKKETEKIKFPFDSKIFLYYWAACKLLNNVRHLNFGAIAKSISGHFPHVIDRLRLISCARKRNLLVSFSGIDGTGKTTHATKLTRTFKDMRIPSQFAECLWSPKLSYPFMALVYLLTGWRRKDYHKSKILRKVWNYIVILDFLFIYLFRIKRHLIIGKTVFADKYVYDLLTTLMYNGLYNEKASRIMLKLFPKPDLVFIFDIPEAVSNKRKDDTIEYVRKFGSDQDVDKYLKIRREGYIKIAKSLGIPIIDARKDFNTLHEKIFNKILERYKNKGASKK